jgi:hypothetical protein
MVARYLLNSFGEKKWLNSRFNVRSEVKRSQLPRALCSEASRARLLNSHIKLVKFAIDLLHQIRQTVQNVAIRDYTQDLLSIKNC